MNLFNRFFSNLAIEGGGAVEGPAQYVSIVVVWLHVIGSNYKLKPSTTFFIVLSIYFGQFGVKYLIYTNCLRLPIMVDLGS